MVLVAVVDDDPSVRTGLDRLLGALGFEVSLFPSAEAFLGELPHRRPGCLILDREMGGMSGDELIVQLMATGQTLPTVVISGLEERDVAHQTSPEGRVVVRLKKPFTAAALSEAIRVVMD
jgi:FixJ family two-component response regulator